MPAYKDKKTNTWYAKFNYKNWKGETKFTTKRGFSTKREAVDYENEYKLHIAGSLDMTFREFVEVYREDRYPRIRVSTSASKDHIIDTKILPYFGKLKVTDIRPKDIVKWQNELGENPVLKAGSIGLSNTEEMQFWTLGEYLLFADAIMEEPFFYYCFEVLYWTGIREGELLALTYDDFDFVNKTISITKTYQVVKGKEIIGPPKTSKGIRIVNMPDRLCDEMKDYFEMCYDKGSNRAFATSKHSLKKAMRRGAKEAGVKEIRIHDLRHSHISLLISLGFSPVEIAKRVGHESITITLRYAHMFPSAQKDMMDKLNRLTSDEPEED